MRLSKRLVFAAKRLVRLSKRLVFAAKRLERLSKPRLLATKRLVGLCERLMLAGKIFVLLQMLRQEIEPRRVFLDQGPIFVFQQLYFGLKIAIRFQQGFAVLPQIALPFGGFGVLFR